MVHWVKQVVCIVFLLLLPLTSISQRVGPQPAILRLEKVNTLQGDGLLTFEINVRMADCLQKIELNDAERVHRRKTIWDKIHDWWWFRIRKIYDFEVSHTFSRELQEDDYYLSEDGNEQIYMKCELISLKSIYKRKENQKRLEINVYSKSGKKIYSKTFILDRERLIQNSEYVIR
jgi:hypothetical protein